MTSAAVAAAAAAAFASSAPITTAATNKSCGHISKLLHPYRHHVGVNGNSSKRVRRTAAMTVSEDGNKGNTPARIFQLAASVTAGAILGTIIASSSTLWPSSQTAQAYTQAQTMEEEDTQEGYLASEEQVISLFEKATQSVAFVTTYTESRGGFSLNPMETPAGTGSGIVWDKSGHIVTNFHVIRSASGAKITLSNKKTYDAQLVGSSADDDVAVLKIEAPANELQAINLGNSNHLKVGQSTYAIGNPFGLDHTLTSGVLSGLGREMKSPTGRTISNVIQTEASINPGNSGGPLIDTKGKLIGMNTAIYSPSGGSAGVGFAIPVDTLKVIANELIKDGKVVRPVIGISYLESLQSKALGVEKGVLVLDVPEDSRAFKVGLRGTVKQTFGSIVLGDVIIGMDEDEIGNESDLFKALDKHGVGDTVRLKVVNTDGERTVRLKLSASQN